jgi:hypothetical protein
MRSTLREPLFFIFNEKAYLAKHLILIKVMY